MGASTETGVESSTRTNRGAGTALGQNVRPRQDATARYQQLADEDRGTGGESLSDFLAYSVSGSGWRRCLRQPRSLG